MAELTARELFSTSWPDGKGRTEGEEGGISKIKVHQVDCMSVILMRRDLYYEATRSGLKGKTVVV